MRFWVVTVPVWLLAPAVLAATARSLLWYHDHVMGTTKLDVKGDSGSPLNDRERDLGLPEGWPFEVPLLIQDRNFDSTSKGG